MNIIKIPDISSNANTAFNKFRCFKRPFNIILWVISFLSFMGIGLYFILPFQDSFITLHLSANKAGNWQIYYDAGGGFHELKSIPFLVEGSKAEEIIRIAIHKDKIYHLRLDPKTDDGENIKIFKIIFEHADQIKAWNGKEILSNSVLKGVSDINLNNDGSLSFVTTRNSIIRIKTNLNKHIKFIKYPLSKKNCFAILIMTIVCFFGFIMLFINKAFLWRIWLKTVESEERLFVIIGIIFGLGYLMITPPFHAPDEATHYFRIYSLTQGILKPSISPDNNIVAYLPSSLRKMADDSMQDIIFDPFKKIDIKRLHAAFQIKTIETQKENIHLGSAALYFPLVYLPQLLGISIGKLAGMQPMFLLYIGRMFVFLSWIYMIYIALCWMPVFKKVALILALSPMSLFLAATISADVMINAASFMFIALLLRYRSESRLKLKQFLPLLGLSILIILSKSVYLPFMLLMLTLLTKNHGVKKEFIQSVVLFILINSIIFLLWSYFINQFIFANHVNNANSILGQKNFILQHPFSYLNLIIHSLWTLKTNYLKSFIGILGWGDVQFAPFVYYFYSLAIILIAGLEGKRDFVVRWVDKLMFLIVVLGVLLLIMTAEFLIATPLGSSEIQCVHGRYFIPISVVLSLLLYNQKAILPIWTKKYMNIFVLLMLTITHIYALNNILLRYYNFRIF